MDYYLIILLAVIFSAYFSGMEIAFIASNKLRIELDRKHGVFGSRITRIFVKNPGQFIATMLIGNNICLVIYGIIISRLLGPFISRLVVSEALTLLVNTIISTAIILFVAEFLPKAVFRVSPNFFLKLLSIPTFFFFLIFYPVAKLALYISNAVLSIFPGGRVPEKENEENIVFSKADLDHFVNINTQEDIQNESERANFKIFQNALDFSDVRVRECMVPRTEIEAVEISSGIENLKERFIATRFSRILVYSETIDQIAGYAELKDMFKNPPDLKSIVRKLVIVPETMPASRLLKQFVDEKVNIALVVDEFGGTSGMVTIEDMLEEIVGEIEDEHDINEFVEKVTGPGEYVFSGRLEIDYLNEKYNLGLPEKDDYETLAGMVLYYHGNIPKANDIIRINN
ncbi:MAG: hemolysin family protein, partial [Bacteroidales bacterium]